ncbi:MAG: class II aldolase/adducin family protein [Thermosulfidibacteraceae bacterium]|jgi:L-fuculose-phosphate aldolase
MNVKRTIIKAGKVLWEEHLVTSHSGNISVREGDFVYITNTGTKLGFLEESDISTVPIQAGRNEYPFISSEWDIHRGLYLNTKRTVIIHAHPPCTVTLSLNYEKIEAIDYEGKISFKIAPVIENLEDRKKLLESLLDKFENYKIVVIRGHGTFTLTDSIEEAIFLTSSLEFSSKVLIFNAIFNKKL